MVKRGNDFLKSIIGRKKEEKQGHFYTHINRNKKRTREAFIHSNIEWSILKKNKKRKKEKKEGRIILSFHSSKKKESKADRFSLDIWLFLSF